jgi:hypothetical protein
VILSAPAPGLLSWAWINPISRMLLPLLAFMLGLGAVLITAERGVIRWIIYLQRVAAIYAKGRFTIRPLQAERAPPEIRELAATLDAMAGAIVTRDASLMDSLAEKDALMREIHHRVKNNLQIITSLLNMQQRALADPAAKAAMNDTRQRITALAQIYRALYQGPDLKRVDLRPFLEELTAQLLANDMGAWAAAWCGPRFTPIRWSSIPTAWRRSPCSRSRPSPTPRSTPSARTAGPCPSVSTCAAKRPNCRSATTALGRRRASAAASAAP